MDSHSNRTARCGRKAARVQHPGVQAHAFGCASVGRRVRPTEILQADVLRRIVVCVRRVAAFLTLESLLRRAVRSNGEATSDTRATLARVRWIDLFGVDTERFGFIRHIMSESVVW